MSTTIIRLPGLAPIGGCLLFALLSGAASGAGPVPKTEFRDCPRCPAADGYGRGNYPAINA